MPSQKSDKNDSIRIIFIKISIKINIKIYTENTHFITTKCDISRIFTKIEYILICIQNSIKFFNHFTCNKPIRNKFQCCWKSSTASSNITYLSGQYTIKEGSSETTLTHFLSFILIRNRIKYKKTSVNCFITHCLSLIPFRNKFYFRRISLNSFITHVLSLSIQEQILMHEGNYQLLYTHFLIFVAVRNGL